MPNSTMIDAHSTPLRTAYLLYSAWYQTSDPCHEKAKSESFSKGNQSGIQTHWYEIVLFRKSVSNMNGILIQCSVYHKFRYSALPGSTLT